MNTTLTAHHRPHSTRDNRLRNRRTLITLLAATVLGVSCTPQYIVVDEKPLPRAETNQAATLAEIEQHRQAAGQALSRGDTGPALVHYALAFSLSGDPADRSARDQLMAGLVAGGQLRVHIQPKNRTAKLAVKRQLLLDSLAGTGIKLVKNPQKAHARIEFSLSPPRILESSQKTQAKYLFVAGSTAIDNPRLARKLRALRIAKRELASFHVREKRLMSASANANAMLRHFLINRWRPAKAALALAKTRVINAETAAQLVRRRLQNATRAGSFNPAANRQASIDYRKVRRANAHLIGKQAHLNALLANTDGNLTAIRAENRLARQQSAQVAGAISLIRRRSVCRHPILTPLSRRVGSVNATSKRVARAITSIKAARISARAALRAENNARAKLMSTLNRFAANKAATGRWAFKANSILRNLRKNLAFATSKRAGAFKRLFAVEARLSSKRGALNTAWQQMKTQLKSSRVVLRRIRACGPAAAHQLSKVLHVSRPFSPMRFTSVMRRFENGRRRRIAKLNTYINQFSALLRASAKLQSTLQRLQLRVTTPRIQMLRAAVQRANRHLAIAKSSLKAARARKFALAGRKSMLKNTVRETQAALNTATRNKARAIDNVRQLRMIISALPKQIITQRFGTLTYMVERVTRRASIRAGFDVKPGSISFPSKTLTVSASSATTDSTHRGFPKHGLRADPLVFGKSDSALLAEAQARLKRKLKRALRPMIADYRNQVLSQARALQNSRAAEATRLYLLLAVHNPSALPADARRFLAKQFGLKDLSILTRS